MENNFSKAISYTAKIIDIWLPYKIKYDQIPGLSVGITYKGKLVYQAGFGYAGLDPKRKATPKTCYRIGSISKMFTTIAILQLCEQGKLNLDDSVEKYLPWFKAKNKKTNSSNITIRQILSHTAGIFRDGTTPHWITDKFPNAKELKDQVSIKTIVFENLTRFKYSNYGFALLGEIIKKASGQNYNQYVNEHIIKKLKLKNTAPDLSEKFFNRLATGWSKVIPDEKRQKFKHIKTKAYSPATGFISNVVDLAKFLSALSFNCKNKNDLFNRESKKEMFRKYWETGREDEFYGLGNIIYKIQGRKIIGHSGGFPGFTSRIALDIKNDIGVITLSNSNNLSVGFINSSILETIYNLFDKKDKYIKGNKKLPNKKRYQGIYRSRWGDICVVDTEENLVAFNPATNSPIEYGTLLRPIGKHKFIIETKSGFDSLGEIAEFIFSDKSKRVKKLMWGPAPIEKIE